MSGGGGYTIEIVGFWNDEITSNGVIIGDVHLGAGSDSDLGTGSVTGIAYGGRGRDNLVGSDNNDRLHGDEGNDFLEGGGGNDIA